MDDAIQCNGRTGHWLERLCVQYMEFTVFRTQYQNTPDTGWEFGPLVLALTVYAGVRSAGGSIITIRAVFAATRTDTLVLAASQLALRTGGADRFCVTRGVIIGQLGLAASGCGITCGTQASVRVGTEHCRRADTGAVYATIVGCAQRLVIAVHVVRRRKCFTLAGFGQTRGQQTRVGGLCTGNLAFHLALARHANGGRTAWVVVLAGHAIGQGGGRAQTGGFIAFLGLACASIRAGDDGSCRADTARAGFGMRAQLTVFAGHTVCGRHGDAARTCGTGSDLTVAIIGTLGRCAVTDTRHALIVGCAGVIVRTVCTVFDHGLCAAQYGITKCGVAGIDGHRTGNGVSAGTGAIQTGAFGETGHFTTRFAVLYGYGCASLIGLAYGDLADRLRRGTDDVFTLALSLIAGVIAGAQIVVVTGRTGQRFGPSTSAAFRDTGADLTAAIVRRALDQAGRNAFRLLTVVADGARIAVIAWRVCGRGGMPAFACRWVTYIQCAGVSVVVTGGRWR